MSTKTKEKPKVITDNSLRWTATLGRLQRYVSSNGTIVSATTIQNCKEAGIEISSDITLKNVATCVISIDGRSVYFRGLTIDTVKALRTAFSCMCNKQPIPADVKEEA